MFGYVTIRKDDLKVKDYNKISGILLRSVSGYQRGVWKKGSGDADV